MSTTLSIIIPAYNAEKYIAETIESALSQTFEDYDIMIVNDGSTDGTAGIINQFSAHPRIKILGYKTNRGAAHAYNYGVLHSDATYITFLDADDIYLPDYCRSVLERMWLDDADIGFANLMVLDGRTPKRETLYGQPRDPRFQGIFGGPDKPFPAGDMALLRRLILTGVHISPRSVYRRQLFLDYGLEDHRLRITHDWLRHIRFMLHGARCTFVPDALGFYRIHPEGNSQRDGLANFVENIKILEWVRRDLHPLMTEEEQQIATASMRSIRTNVFQALANSDMTTQQIIQYLVDKGFQ